MTNEYIKPPVEIRYKNELDALKSVDIGKKPENWVLSPKAVRTFILGGIIKTADGKMQIKRKFYGNDALVERCIITLAGNRGLMLVGEPGTAKTMLSELLSAACCGISTKITIFRMATATAKPKTKPLLRANQFLCSPIMVPHRKFINSSDLTP